MGRPGTRKLPIGIQNFESLVRDGYLYVDKTERIHIHYIFHLQVNHKLIPHTAEEMLGFM